MTDTLRECLKLLLAWEQWEADWIIDSECWAPEGMAPYPRITAKHFDVLVPDLQERRNAVKRLLVKELQCRDTLSKEPGPAIEPNSSE